jgi:1-deoxy-D-xylulose-5-phosphate reductoisomerase
MRRVHLLGSTGSIGRTSERVLAELSSTHRVEGLAAGRDADALIAQAERLEPRAVAVAHPEAGEKVERALSSRGVKVLVGEDAADRLVHEVDADVVLNGIAGARGLRASLAAVRRGLDLALANKESMVMAGPLLRREADRSGARILPVDSEHSAVFQCIRGEPLKSVRRVILTASGGPFRTTPAADLDRVTPEEALRHPTWSMGAKITVDSATLMNKALEVVEARWLFSLLPEQIKVLVHPQSIIHSMVEFRDGSLLAQLGVPDMAVPVRYALCHPDRGETSSSYFDLARFRSLTLEEPDVSRFPALELGFRAARMGGTAGAVLNAANEVAVEAFLRREIPFPRVAPAVAAALDRLAPPADRPEPSLEEILAADRAARAEATACCC